MDGKVQAVARLKVPVPMGNLWNGLEGHDRAELTAAIHRRLQGVAPSFHAALRRRDTDTARRVERGH
eukprot:10198738-Alexandrium_andersonii.AAC.1